jgi:hypothetical protein
MLAACQPTAFDKQLERQRDEARDDLTRWADAVAAAGGPGFALVGEATGQIGDWEERVGANNKLALLSGKVETAVPLSADTPPPAQVRWMDGSAETVPIISAARALAELQATEGQGCPDCNPLVITGATLTSAKIDTSRGPATVPVWQFSLQGTTVRVTRAAISPGGPVHVSPPEWNPDDPPIGLSVSWAFGHAGGRALMVGFDGDSCGTDYTAEAVESPSAIVVIIVEHPSSATCGRGVGMNRTATAQLAAPLGGRTVLEVREGLPVPLTLVP